MSQPERLQAFDTEREKIVDVVAYESEQFTFKKAIYRHYKGNFYQIEAVAKDSSDEVMVVYRPLYDTDVKLFARSYDMFFEDVTIDDSIKKRFEKFPTKMPVFITGNQSKAEYLSKLLEISLPHQKVELEEIQSLDLHEIVAYKLQQAYKVVGRAVLVEDVSLVFNALGDLPGPYIKWFTQYAGDVACCKMLDGFTDRTAKIRCTFGYYDGKNMEFFDSEMTGSISKQPRGAGGFGFDTIFINDGYDITRAEMSPEENQATYRDQMKPIAKVRKFLQTLSESNDE